MDEVASPGEAPARTGSARRRVGVSIGVGLIVGVAIGWAFKAPLGPLAGWDVAALVYLTWTWRKILPMDAAQTAAHAKSEDPSRAAADLVLVIAAVASLVAVGVVVVQAGSGGSLARGLQVGLGVASVVASWAIVHTVNAVRYARLYYNDHVGGADFHQDEPPQFSDFAYLAFTVGMTFQVSDTELNTGRFRAAVLRHALLSYLFGTVIVALTINLVAGLTK